MYPSLKRWRDGKRPEFGKGASVKVPANIMQLKSPVQAAQPVTKVYPQHRMLTLPSKGVENPTSTSTSRQVPVPQADSDSKCKICDRLKPNDGSMV